MSESIRRARYTLEFKLEAVRLLKGGQVAAVTAKILGIPPNRRRRTGYVCMVKVHSRVPATSQ